MKTLLCSGKLSLLLWIIVIFPVPSWTNAQEFVLVTHKYVEDALDRDDVKHIFLGKKTRWANNTSITFVLPADRELCALFFKEYLGKSYTQYFNYWKKQVFTGKGRMPVLLQNEQELLTFVAQTQGAISFVPAQHTSNEHINIIPLIQK